MYDLWNKLSTHYEKLLHEAAKLQSEDKAVKLMTVLTTERMYFEYYRKNVVSGLVRGDALIGSGIKVTEGLNRWISRLKEWDEDLPKHNKTLQELKGENDHGVSEEDIAIVERHFRWKTLIHLYKSFRELGIRMLLEIPANSPHVDEVCELIRVASAAIKLFTENNRSCAELDDMAILCEFSSTARDVILAVNVL